MLVLHIEQVINDRKQPEQKWLVFIARNSNVLVRRELSKQRVSNTQLRYGGELCAYRRVKREEMQTC